MATLGLNSHVISRTRVFSRLFAALAIAVGASVLVGWIFQIESLKSVIPGFATMKFNTALGFVVSGGAVLAFGRRKRVMLVCATSLLLLGLLTLLEYFTGWNLGIDELFVRDVLDEFHTGEPGRMAFVSALNFTLIGASLLLMARGRRIMTAQILILAVGFIAILSLAGYLYSVRGLYEISILSTIALHSAIAFLGISLALLLASSESGLMREITANRAGGLLARRLLPAVTILPILMAWIRLKGQQAGLYDTEFGLALFALSNVVLFTVLIFGASRALNRVDEDRSSAAAALKVANEQLELRVQQRTKDLAAANEELAREIAERRRSDSLYRTLVENLPNTAVIMFDRDFRYQIADGPILKATGYSRETMLGKTIFEVLPPASQQTLIPLYQRVLDGETIQNERKVEGLYYDSKFLPVVNDDDEVTSGLIVVEEITKRRQAEQALRTSEEQFRTMFEHAAIGMALVSLEGRWLRVNQAVCDLVGYTEDEVMALTFQDITHPEDLETDLKYVTQMLSGDIQTYQMEKRYIHKLGHIVWVLLSVSLVRDSEDKPLHFVSQIQNITEHKEAEAALQSAMNESYVLQDYLRGLHEISLELTQINNLDEFFRRVVELGLARLGFERLGLLLYDSEHQQAIGTYGTDAKGGVAAEHTLRLDPAHLTGILKRSLDQKEWFIVDHDAELFSDSRLIGTGWNAAAVLWNGADSMGWLTADNGVNHEPMSAPFLNILALYAQTVSGLLARKRAEVELQTNRAKLQTFFDVLPVGMSVLDDKGRIVETNPALERILDISVEALQAGAYRSRQYIHSDGTLMKADEFPSIRAQREAQVVNDVVIGVVKEDQAIVWTSVSAAPLPLAKSGTIVVTTDITDRKRFEDALANERNMLRTLIDSMIDRIYVKDLEGRFLVNNVAHADALGIPDPNAMVGMTDFDYFPEAIARQFREEDLEVISTGQPLVDMEEQVIVQHGNPIITLTTKVPLRAHDSSVVGLVGITRDITRQKQAALALERSEQLLRTVLENLPVGVMITDAAGNVTFGNPALQKIWGGLKYVSIESYGEYKGWWANTGEPIAPEEWAAARATRMGETTINDEVEIECFDGTHKFILNSAIPMRDSEQNDLGTFIVNQDVTDIKRASIALQESNAELQSANEEIQNFAYIVSHDLRAPLINLKGFSDILAKSLMQLDEMLSRYAPDLAPEDEQVIRTAIKEKIPTALRFIGTSVDRMDAFTSSILKLSRLGRHQLNYEWLAPDELVGKILQSLDAQIKDQGITVRVEELPKIWGDRLALDQILSNIIVNAIKYLDPLRPGEITISAESSRHQTIFHVADNGRGIAEADHEKVFAPFRRAGRPTVDGEGMGLAYVQALVKRLGGQLRFASQLGVGSTFSFTIPNQQEVNDDVSSSRHDSSR